MNGNLDLFFTLPGKLFYTCKCINIRRTKKDSDDVIQPKIATIRERRFLTTCEFNVYDPFDVNSYVYGDGTDVPWRIYIAITEYHDKTKKDAHKQMITNALQKLK